MLNNAIADQQTKLSQAVSGPLISKMGDLSMSIDQFNATLGAMNERLSKVEKKLGDVSDAVRTINQPPPQVPTAVNVPGADASANGVPHGYTPAGLQEEAQGDYTTGNDEMAVKELRDYVKYYPTDAWAPTAGYLMGMGWTTHQRL